MNIVNTKSPYVPNHALGDDSLWLVLEKVDEILSDTLFAGAWFITDGWKQDGFACVSRRDFGWIQGRQRIVPESKQVADFLVVQDGLLGLEGFWHLGAVVVSDFPLSILVNIDKGIASLDLCPGCTHGEFINTRVL